MKEQQGIITGIKWLVELLHYKAKTISKNCMLVLFAVALAGHSAVAAKLETSYPTDAEISALPAYCHAKLRASKTSTEVQHWKSVLGKDYVHVHHLCAARAFLIRANRMDENRGFYLNSALDNLDYMISHASQTFILMPEILYYKGYIYYKKKEYPQAVKFSEESIRNNKKYIKPYLLLADIYLKQNDIHNAEKIIKKAKELFPKSRAVKRRIKKLKKLSK